ncbi:hypothetical protein FHU41_001238 [Psychromicrobium silvestre]|uniref:Uncharacterized protein n=1 Tax=Psychromicrobium silvestre TaxID=1645614 RepID=A0A7Y9S827_9MICC|nr:hypothetical protein [Psychromicrobium silvestre]NYE95017.1 hypothetical protein [Psychromicrobium silvestre]
MNKETKIIRATLSGLIAGALLLTPAVVAQANNPARPSQAAAPETAAAAGAPVSNANSPSVPPASTTPGSGAQASGAQASTTPDSSVPQPATTQPSAVQQVAATPSPTISQQTPAAPLAATPTAKAPLAAKAPQQSATPQALTSSTITVTLSKNTTKPGQTVVGTVGGLTATDPATVTLVAQQTAGPQPSDFVCDPIPAGAAPNINCVLPVDQPEGTYHVVVTQPDALGVPQSGSSEDLYVLNVDTYNPQIAAPSLPIVPGSTGTLTGTGYSPGSQVKISTDAVRIPGGTATIDASGNFSFTLQPGPFTQEGAHTVTVVDQTTGVTREATIYVLRASGNLQLSVNTGVEGGYSTNVTGDSFSDGSYQVDLKLYSSDGATVVADLASGVQISNNAFSATPVSVPATAAEGLYQVSATTTDPDSGQVIRLAATWLAVFPKTKTVAAPPQIIEKPVYVTVPAAPAPAPLPIAPVIKVQAAAPAPLPALIHQATTTLSDDPFGLKADAAAKQLPNLNSSSPTVKPGAGSVSADPTPQKPSPEQSGGSSTAQGAPLSGTQIVQSSQDIWPLIWVGLIFILIGLILGYIIALAGTRRNRQAAH